MTTHAITTADLHVESDIIMMRVSAIALALGIGLSAYFATIEFILPYELETGYNEPVKQGSVTIKMPDEKKPTAELPPKKVIKKPQPGRTASGAKSTVKGSPTAIRSTSLLAILEARSNKMNQSAYNTMNAKIHQDMDKVLKSGARLMKTGTAVIGERRGKVNGDFNGYSGDNTSGGIEDVLGSIFGTPAGIPGTKVPKGNIKIPKEGDISMPDGIGGRSVSEIMAVVKARTPGLRHIYNKYLKLHPGFAGKITLQFTILAGGDVVECKIKSSTTEVSDFDEDIREAVERWSFKMIKSGNTTVAIPFNFSE